MRILACSMLFLAFGGLSTNLIGQRDLQAGLGAQFMSVDVEDLVESPGSRGVVQVFGSIFVATTRRLPAMDHTLKEYDGDMNLLNSYLQPPIAQATGEGFYDGTSDGFNLIWAMDGGLLITTSTGAPSTQLRPQNGIVQAADSQIDGAYLDLANANGIVHAAAFDRSGNGGDGSFWTARLDSSIFEINIAGDVLQTLSRPGDTNHGFALDPTSLVGGSPTRMWVNSIDAGKHLAEYDLSTGTLTGNRIDLGIHAPRDPGGMDILPASIMRGAAAGGYDILHLQQGPDALEDVLHVQRLHLDVAGLGTPPRTATRLGTLEPDLLSSIDDEAVIPRDDIRFRAYDVSSTALNIYLDISRNPGDGMGTGGLNGTPAVIFANLGPDADFLVDAESNLLGIRELAHLQPFLTTPAPAFAPRSRGVVLTNDPTSAAPSEWRIPLMPGMPFQGIGDCVRFQGLWLDNDVPFLPLALTNQIRTCRMIDPVVGTDVFAECLGSNSFNADTSFGFFSVTNYATDANKSIVQLVFTTRPGDPGNSPATQALNNAFFHFDRLQSNANDERFTGGNSLRADCNGTYRNKSDWLTGLIYEGTPLPFCDEFENTPARQGFTSSDSLGNPNTDQTITFRFLPGMFMNGKKFEFDADTDMGVGTNGSAMAGLIIEAHFADGSMVEGEIVADPMNVDRGFVQL